MPKSIFLFSLLALGAFVSQAQEFFCVVAENGLVVRLEPDLSGTRIAKLDCGEYVELLQRTGKKFKIGEGANEMAGEWFEIKSLDKIEGFVFSGYLVELATNPKNTIDCDGEYGACHSHIDSKNFELTIFNYQAEGRDQNSDTLVLYEAVFNEIGDKLIRIKPKGPYQNIEVFYTRAETLNGWGSTKNEDGIVPKWQGHAPFIPLEKTNGVFFKTPTTDYETVRENRAAALKLKRAPEWEQGGEGGWMPIYLYKGVRAPYQIASILLKVVISDVEGVKHEQLVEIELSYGC